MSQKDPKGRSDQTKTKTKDEKYKRIRDKVKISNIYLFNKESQKDRKKGQDTRTQTIFEALSRIIET